MEVPMKKTQTRVHVKMNISDRIGINIIVYIKMNEMATSTFFSKKVYLISETKYKYKYICKYARIQDVVHICIYV